MRKGKEQITIFTATALLLLGFVLFRYMPLRSKAKNIEQQKTLQNKIVAEAAELNSQLPELKARAEELKNLIRNYQANIPAKRDLGNFLQEIADLMGKHNLKGQLIEPSKQIETENVNCIPVTIKGKGTLPDIFKFYKSLQDMDRLVRFDQIELINAQDFSGEVKMQTKAVIFYQAQKEAGVF